MAAGVGACARRGLGLDHRRPLQGVRSFLTLAPPGQVTESALATSSSGSPQTTPQGLNSSWSRTRSGQALAPDTYITHPPTHPPTLTHTSPFASVEVKAPSSR